MDWRSNAAIDELKRYVDLGIPYPSIAQRMGTTVGSICGKVHRLKIGKGPKYPDRLYLKAKRGPDTTPSIEHLRILKRQAIEAAAREGTTIALESADDCHCRYVIGDPAQRRICGAPRLEGTPYCQEHATLCMSVCALETRNAISAGNVGKKHGPPLYSFKGVPLKPVARLMDTRTFEEADAPEHAPDLEPAAASIGA